MVRQNLKKNENAPRTLEKGIGALYRDDCFGLGFSIKRQYYKDRDLKPATIFLVTLFLKNIGDFSYSFDQGIFGEKSSKNDDSSS
jgi:hypothetical protein